MSIRKTLPHADISRIIEMAWEDHTPFEAIKSEYGLDESACIKLMRQEMTASSFKMWRKRVTGRSTKHAKHASVKRIKHRAYGHNKVSSKQNQSRNT